MSARLVLAPHADDEVLGCGGLLAKYPGETVVAVAARVTADREAESGAAEAVLGYQIRQGPFRNGRVGADLVQLQSWVDHLVNQFRPVELYNVFEPLTLEQAQLKAAALACYSSQTPGGAHITSEVAAWRRPSVPSVGWSMPSSTHS